MNAPCAATTGVGESCEFKNDQALPPVDDTLGEVTNIYNWLMKACSRVSNYQIQ